MGQVYRVRNVVSQRVEAMKILLPDLASEPKLADRFLAEIRVLASLEHPNIAQLRTAFQSGNQLLMVMEFVDGEALDVRCSKPTSAGETLRYFEQILDALAYAHGRGIIHRDVKPANIMISSSGQAKLLDFGIAKEIHGERTQPGTTLGSVQYMSPEQVRGESVDARADLYAVGVVLYQVITGRRPFEADNVFRLMEMHLNEQPPAPIEVNSDVPEALSQIVMMALAKDPTSRFQRAEAMKNAIAGVRQSLEPAPVPTVNPVVVVPTSKSNRGLWVTIGALVAVAVLVLAAVVVPRWSRTQARATTEQTTEAPPAASPQPVAETPDAQPTPSEPSPQQAHDAIAAPITPATAVEQSVNPKKQEPHPARGAVKHQTIYDVVPERPQEIPAPVPPVAVPNAQLNKPVSTEQAEKGKERLIQLASREAAVKESIDRLRQEQAASGLGLRQDISAAANRMGVYMGEAENALNAGDWALCSKRADQAEKEIVLLEEFTGR
jgi:serine/threonine-protein kinase